MEKKQMGEFLRSLRTEKKLSQQQIADYLYVDRTLVNKWEMGKVAVTSENLSALSKFYKVTVDELIAGHRIDKKSSQNHSDVLLTTYDKNVNLSKKIEIIVGGIIIFIFLFLIYFFFTFYNSVKIYSFSNENIIDSCTLIKTRDYVQFYLKVNIDSEFDSVNLYYLDDEQKNYIVKSYDSEISFQDYSDYQEYIDFKNINKIIDNLYIEVMHDDTSDIYKLEKKLKYSNFKIIYREKSGFKGKTAELQKSNKITSLYEKYSNDGIQVVYLNNILYNISFSDYGITVEYELDEESYCIDYTYVNSEYIIKYINDSTIYEVKLDKTDDSLSEEIVNDRELIYEIIDNLLET